MSSSPEEFQNEVITLMKTEREKLDKKFFNRFVSGELSKAQLQAYYDRLYWECDGAMKIISLVHARASERDQRELVAANLVEEYAHGDMENNHPRLALRCGVAVGCDEKKILSSGPPPEIDEYYKVLWDYAMSSYLEGLAAFTTIEAELVGRHVLIRKALLEKYKVPKSAVRFYDEHISETSSIRDGSGYGGDDIHVARQTGVIAKYAVRPEQREAVSKAICGTIAARNRLNKRFYELCIEAIPN